MTFVEQVQQFWLRNAKIRNGHIPDIPLRVESERPTVLGRLFLILALICFGLALAMLAPVIVEWFRSFLPEDPPLATTPPTQTQQESLYQYLEDGGQNVPLAE